MAATTTALSLDPPKVGIYLCTGCGICDVLDAKRIIESISSSPPREIAISREHANLCSAEGLQVIQEDIRTGRVNRVVIAACSPRANQDLFSEALLKENLGPELMERANIREQCAWVHHNDPEGGNLKATDMIRMAISRAAMLEPLKSSNRQVAEAVLIVGGGIAGISAALEVAEAGNDAYLVEKKPYIGGRVAQNHLYFPKLCPPYCGLEFNFERLRKNRRVKILPLSEVTNLSGSPGDFDATIKSSPSYIDPRKCVACGECARVCPVEAPNDFDFGMSKHKAAYLPHDMAYPFRYVIDGSSCKGLNGGDCRECVKVCKYDAIDLEDEPQEIHLKTGAVIVTTGWDPYNAIKVTEHGFGVYKNVITNVLMERLAANNGPTKGEIIRPSDGKKVSKIAFIQCSGSRDERHLPYCSAVCCTVTMKQAQYVRAQNPDAEIYIFYMDIRTTGEYEDLYVKTQQDPKTFFVRGRVAAIREDKTTNNITVQAEQTLLGEKFEAEVDLVVLATGMVSSFKNAPKTLALTSLQSQELPVNKYSFPESNFICFPYESRRTGIFTAGACKGPMDVSSSVRDAIGAAARSLSTITRMRTVEPTYPTVDNVKCNKCYRCTQECPFDTFSFDENKFPVADILKCRRCGACFGACPVQAISFKDFTIAQVSSMIKSVKLEGDEPRILGFFCTNDAYPVMDLLGANRTEYPSNMRIVKVPCLGSVNVAWVKDALSAGFDGILMMGCKAGAEYQCHYIKGSELAQARMQNIRDTLGQMALEEDRVKIMEIGFADYRKVPSIITEYVKKLKEIGPNPFKGL